MANAQVNGIPVNFGFQGGVGAEGSQGLAITGVSGILLQSAEQTKVAECEKVKDGNGNDVVHAWFNFHDEVSLEWIVSADTLAHAITFTSGALKNAGSIIVITGCTSMPSLVGTCWEVQSGVKVQGSNTTSKKVTFPIHLYPGITQAAT